MSGWRGGWGGRGARVCAARAALHAQFAAALLLDEPGAALDALAERMLLQAFSAMAPNTTIITVAVSIVDRTLGSHHDQIKISSNKS